jgi:hypothetical protein
MGDRLRLSAEASEGRMIRTVVVLLFLTLPVFAQPGSPAIAQVRETNPAHTSKLWTASCFLLVAGTSLDVASSWGKYEANPLLRSSDGRFGAKGLSLKLAITGAILVPQYMMRNNPTVRKLFTFTNFAQAGMYTGIAARNFTIESPPRK